MMNLMAAGWAAVLITICAGEPLAQTRVYICPDNHTDHYWEADTLRYQQELPRMLDYYLDLADSTRDEEADFQSRFNCDGTIWLYYYRKSRSDARLQRLIERIRDGHISVMKNTASICYGAMPAEAVIRDLYCAGRFERRYGLSFPVAMAQENQTLPLGLGSLWAGAGVKYSWKGICNCATRIDAAERDFPLYWWTGLDSSRILMKWYSQTGRNRSLGGYAEAYDPYAAVDSCLSLCRRPGYPFGIAAAFGHGWDHVYRVTGEFVKAAKARSGPDVRVIVSNEIDFFRDVEATYGASLPRQSLAFGNEWDLYSFSLAEVTAQVRRAVEKLRTAEALAAIVSLFEPGFMVNRRAAAERTWRNLGLYWVHSWTADGPDFTDRQRADWARGLAGQITAYVERLLGDAMDRLEARVTGGGSIHKRFLVFNPLSWKRRDVADLPYDKPGPVQVYDLARDVFVPSQSITLDGRRYVRILAQDVPPVGYKVYEVRAGGKTNTGSTLHVDAASGAIDNEIYSIKMNSDGSIRSLKDKRLCDREFIRPYQDLPSNSLGRGNGTLFVENFGPVSVTLRAVCSDPLEHTTTLTLYRDLDRIDIRNEITENFAGDRWWSFGFDFEHPEVWHEEIGAVLRAKRASRGGHYADRNARTDWLSLNHFVDMTEGAGPSEAASPPGIDGPGITLATVDCPFFQLGSSTVSHLDESTPAIKILAGATIDGGKMGISGQGGDRYFLQRFSLRTHGPFDPAQSMRFSLEACNPLVTGEIGCLSDSSADSPIPAASVRRDQFPGPDQSRRAGDFPGAGESGLPGDEYSFLTVSDSSVLVWALKPHEDGVASKGLVVRLWNMDPAPRRFSLSMPTGRFLAGRQINHVETDIGPAQVRDGVLTARIRGHEMKSWRFTPRTIPFQPRRRK